MIREKTTVELEKINGIFIGTVVQHLAHGKLKVYIHGIHPIEFHDHPEMLPTCMQMVPQFGGSHEGNGVFSYPNIGATVLCTFANGDQNLPIMLGSLQGGENAFGQYEIVKKSDEISSDRHLITSGKSHVEMYENGKISAIVFDPIRTEAKVTYNNTIDGELSVDAVNSRPICEQVDSEEISNINCQIVLDNNFAHGTVSASTHWYDPTKESNVLSLDEGQTIIVSSLNGENRNDYHYVAGNDGMLNDGHISSTQTIFTMNKTSTQTNSMEQFVNANAGQVSVLHHYGVDGNEHTDITQNLTNSSNYYQKTSDGNILSTYNATTKNNTRSNKDVKLEFSIHNDSDCKMNESYTNSTTNEVRFKQLKSNASNSLDSNKNLEMSLETLSSSRLFETNTLLQIMPHVNKHKSSSKIDIKSENGISADSSYYDLDSQTIGNYTIVVKKDYCTNVDAQTNKDPSLKMHTRYKIEKSINGATDKKHIECTNNMLPVEKMIEVSIIDKVNKNSCIITLNADGEATIETTSKIFVKSPDIKFTGETLTQEFKTINLKANTMNIQGKKGDCKIKNVSLLNHRHMETQSGDYVTPKPSKTAAKSN